MQISLEFIQIEALYDYLVLSKMFRNISERKHEYSTHKIEKYLKENEHETKSRKNIKLLLAQYSNSKSTSQKTYIFRSKILGNRTLIDIKQPSNNSSWHLHQASINPFIKFGLYKFGVRSMCFLS